MGNVRQYASGRPAYGTKVIQVVSCLQYHYEVGWIGWIGLVDDWISWIGLVGMH